MSAPTSVPNQKPSKMSQPLAKSGSNQLNSTNSQPMRMPMTAPVIAPRITASPIVSLPTRRFAP
jgi:hypothetical protein